jgi:alcohol dehydrogenase
MRGWKVKADGSRQFAEIGDPCPPDDGITIRMQAAPVLVQSRQALELRLGYTAPPTPFVPGTHGIGIVDRVGEAVRHLAAGQRVFLDPQFTVNERVTNPARILIGVGILDSDPFDGVSAPSVAALRQWHNGTYAEFACMPASAATPLPKSLDDITGERLAGLGKFAVPYGGLLRANFEPGETVIVLGASGYLGSAAVLLALALGAKRVVAAARDATALAALVAACDQRVAAVALTGDIAKDSAALRRAADGPADITLDLTSRTADGGGTLAGMNALRRGGRLVLMGSTPLPLTVNVRHIMMNDWQVMGSFMYPRHVPARLAGLVEARLLDLNKLTVRAFPLADLDSALEAASSMRGLDLTALVMDDTRPVERQTHIMRIPDRSVAP